MNFAELVVEVVCETDWQADLSAEHAETVSKWRSKLAEHYEQEKKHLDPRQSLRNARKLVVAELLDRWVGGGAW